MKKNPKDVNMWPVEHRNARILTNHAPKFLQAPVSSFSKLKNKKTV